MNVKSHMVGIYVRLSNDDERTGESVSIENQKMLLTKYVKEQGWELKNTYCDDGFSGTNQNRPGFQRMMRDVENKIINTIVVKDLSRLGRNYLEVGTLAEEFLPSMGCELISLNEKIDEMMVFRNWFNENHSKETSKKVKAVKKMFAESGKFLGTYAPYGFKKDAGNKHLLIIDEKAAPIVQRIFELRSQGKGFRAIACMLNDEKITPPREYYYENKEVSNPCSNNGFWNDVTIRKIIRNEAYIGNMVQCKTGTKSYKTRKLTAKPKEEWIQVENTHEPIISLELWQKVKDIDTKKYKPRKRINGETNIFTGLLKCADCGAPMRISVERGKRKDGSEYAYTSFICSNYSRSGNNACSVHTIYENVLNELVLDSIRTDARLVLKSETRIANSITGMKNSQATSYLKTYEREMKNHQTRLAKLDSLIQKLYEDRLDGSIPESIFKDLMAKYEQERMDRRSDVSGIEKKLSGIRKDTDDAAKWISLIKPYANLEKLDAETLLTLIDKIVVNEAEKVNGRRICDVHIYYKYVGNIEWIKLQGMKQISIGGYQNSETPESEALSHAI